MGLFSTGVRHLCGIIVPLLFTAVLLLPGSMPARETIIDNAACQSLYLHDEEGRLVTGAEDLVISPSGRSVFISAYDRRRVERETDSGVVETQGGI